MRTRAMCYIGSADTHAQGCVSNMFGCKSHRHMPTKPHFMVLITHTSTHTPAVLRFLATAML